ncbi:MAG TPA: TetR/AcrR family transcriptional regulator [Pirellulales bacterium]
MTKTERIIVAARKRFDHYGINKTTMQEIATDAGVAVGTVYLYFANKDELIVACAEDFVEHHRQLADTILANDSPADAKLKSYVVARFSLAAQLRTSSRHAAEIARAVLRVKPDRIQEEGLMMWQYVTEILKLGNEQRVFRIAHPEHDAKVFLYSIACFFPNALANPPMEPEEADLVMVVDWFTNVWRGTDAQHKVGKAKSRVRARRLSAGK